MGKYVALGGGANHLTEAVTRLSRVMGATEEADDRGLRANGTRVGCSRQVAAQPVAVNRNRHDWNESPPATGCRRRARRLVAHQRGAEIRTFSSRS